MLKILTLLCVLAAVLAALVLFSWIKSRRGKGDDAARLYSILSKRNANYRRFQYPQAAIAVIILAVALGMGTDWTRAAAYVIGAVVCFGSVMLATGAGVSGINASSSAASAGDLQTSLRASYRTGAVSGFIAAAAALVLLSFVFIGTGSFSFADSAFAFALGASTSALFLNAGGAVYSSAYALASADDDFTDTTGFLSGFGADHLESAMVAGASAVMLADVGVATSGITSTFTADHAAKFPLIILACGIIASIIGTLIYRGGKISNPASSATASCIAAGVITAAVSFYFSNRILQSFVYAITITIGIAAGLILAEFSKLFAADSRLHMAGTKTDRLLGRHASVLFNLASGMVSTLLYAVIIIAAVSVSYNFASYYGVALCAVGLCSINAAISAVAGLSVASGTASEIVRPDSDAADNETTDISDVLWTASIRTGISAKSYSATSCVLASVALLLAISYNADVQTLNFLSIRAFAGLIGGAAITLTLYGLTLISVRLTGAVALRSLGRTEDEGAAGSLRGSFIPAIISVAAPAVTGLFFGLNVLIPFLGGALIAGCLIYNTINNSGRHFENTAAASISSYVKMMLIFSAAFIPAFIRIGSFIF